MSGESTSEGAVVPVKLNRGRVPLALAVGVLAMTAAALPAVALGGDIRSAASATTTPVKHLVVIFQENVSFDHYFATYPKASNPAGEPQFLSLIHISEPTRLGMISY